MMDFFDVRKLSANLARESHAAGAELRYRDEDYSLIALFPVVMIGAVIVIICGAYRLRRWKLEKRQLDQLSFFYDLVEGAECDRLGHDRHCAGCDRLRAALVVPPARSSPFFQPPPAKGKKNRLEVPISTASSVDISCQISKLLFHEQDAQVV